MPTIDANKAAWGDAGSWQRGGDEWSDAWGTPEAMWYGTILPRISSFLPATNLLEIAPGHGRVTAFLLEHCSRYVGVDVTPECVKTCKKRFTNRTKAKFHVSDGKSLPAVKDESIDFAISWDSLVHADRTALEGYISELGRKLRPGASAFIHHSNLGAFVDADGKLTVENPHWRDTTTSAELIAEACVAAKVQCVCQELVQWGTDSYSDSYTVLRRPAADEKFDPSAKPRVTANARMGEEIGYCRFLNEHYRGE